MEKRELKDFLRQQTANLLNKLQGEGIKETDNLDSYYLVLTKEKLHYLRYATEGNCKEHLSFKREHMTNLECGKVTGAEMMKNKAILGDTKRLRFVSNDIEYKFFFYSCLFAHPQGITSGNIHQEFAELNYLFAEPFKSFANQYETVA
jgi:hypothetical protein